MLLNCGVGEDSWESLGLQVWSNQTKGDQFWVFIGGSDVEAETPILCPPDAKRWLFGKDPDAGKDWRWGREGDTWRWYGWMTSPTQWTWVWVNSRSWWWSGRPGVLWFMGLQRVGHDWATELILMLIHILLFFRFFYYINHYRVLSSLCHTVVPY